VKNFSSVVQECTAMQWNLESWSTCQNVENLSSGGMYTWIQNSYIFLHFDSISWPDNHASAVGANEGFLVLLADVVIVFSVFRQIKAFVHGLLGHINYDKFFKCRYLYGNTFSEIGRNYHIPIFGTDHMVSQSKWSALKVWQIQISTILESCGPIGIV